MQSMGEYSKIIIIGTCDTKLDELLYFKERTEALNECGVSLVDVGRSPSRDDRINVTNSELLKRASISCHLDGLEKFKYIRIVIDCAIKYVRELHQAGLVRGIAGAGGSSGTSIAAAVMRDALPVGIPKLIVSTMASGNIRPYVDDTDITMMYSVVDIAGNNSILHRILTNAAGAVAGMATSITTVDSPTEDRSLHAKVVGVTMFGVTTPCVDKIQSYLKSKYGYEVIVFHATGTGGRSLERLVGEKKIDAVIDLTTTEIADKIVGGVLSAGPERLSASAKAGIPQIISVGATDMVNFGPMNTVPERFNNRILYEHNPQMTLMRTTSQENKMIGTFMVHQLIQNISNPRTIRVILPTKGVSMLSTKGGPFYDPEAQEALYNVLKSGLHSSGIEVEEMDNTINDPEFAVFVADRLVSLIKSQG